MAAGQDIWRRESQRIQQSAANGSTAELERLETNLPQLARLDQTGRLTFAFGGQLRVR